MDKKELEKCSSEELCDLLAYKTLKLLDAVTKKDDRTIIKDYRNEVEALQKILKGREKSAPK